MRVFISRSLLGILLMFTSFMVGCSITVGDFVPNSNFAFPNSNVEPLGQVTTEISKTAVFFCKGC